MAKKVVKYMNDDFRAAGTSIKELIETAGIVDENTGVRQCNFSDGEILHFSGYKNMQLNFVIFDPDSPVKVVEDQGRFFCRLPQNKVIGVSGFLNNGVFEIVQDMQNGKNKTVFNLKSSFPEQSNGILFTSDILKKTMLPRLTNNRLNITEEYAERDLLLAKIIGMTPEDVKKYVVYRYSGPIKKAISIFGRDPKRVSFRDVALAAKTYHKKMTCEKWEITNRFGLSASFSVEELTDMTQELFPGLKYKPVITLIACDSGHLTNKVMVGWYNDLCKEVTPFYTHDLTIEDTEDAILTYQQCIDGCIEPILQDTKHLLAMSKRMLDCTEEGYNRAVMKVAKSCLIDANAGTKAKSILIQRSQERNFAKTQLDMLEMLMDIVEKGDFFSSSAYADTRIRELGVRHFFQLEL